MTRVLNFIACALIAMMVLPLGGCKKSENPDTAHLLSTVPSDASSVLVIDVPQMLERAGCKVKEGKLQLTDELKSALGRQKDFAGLGDAVEQGRSGIDLKPFVAFTEGDVVYVTGLLEDVAAFKSYAASQQGEEFRTEQGVDICGYFAVKGTQFWYSRSTLGAKEINRFASLDEARSFLSSQYCEDLLESESDLTLWADVSAFLRQICAPSSRPTAILASAALFKDAQTFLGTADFKRGKLEAIGRIMDGEGNPAKFLLDARTLGKEAFEQMDCNGDLFAGVYLSQKFVRKITENASALITLPSTDMLACIDGPAVLATDEMTDNFKLVISTNGASSTALGSLLMSTKGNIRTEQGKLIVENGTLSGRLSSKDAASTLGDAYAGIILSPSADEKLPVGSGREFRTISLLIKPSGNSVKLELECEMADPKQPSLPQLLGK